MFVLAQNGAGGFDYMTILFLVGIVAVFYLLILRPAKKREQDRKQMIESLKKGSQIVSIGGIYGTVTAIKENDIIVRIDSEKDVRVKMSRGAVNKILDDEKSLDDSEESKEAPEEDSEKI